MLKRLGDYRMADAHQAAIREETQSLHNRFHPDSAAEVVPVSLGVTA